MRLLDLLVTIEHTARIPLPIAIKLSHCKPLHIHNTKAACSTCVKTANSRDGGAHWDEK